MPAMPGAPPWHGSGATVGSTGQQAPDSPPVLPAMASAIQQATSHMNDEIERLSRRVAQLEAIDVGQRVDSVIRVKRDEINDDVALAHAAPRARPLHFLIETPVPSTRDIRNYVDELEELIKDTRDVHDLAKMNQDRISYLEESLEGLTDRVRISEAAVEDSNLKYKTVLDYQGARTFSRHRPTKQLRLLVSHHQWFLLNSRRAGRLSSLLLPSHWHQLSSLVLLSHRLPSGLEARLPLRKW